MITSEDNFILATPTKCGTTTLEAIARRHMRNNVDCDDFRIMDWDSPRRQHRMALPPLMGHNDMEVKHEGEMILTPGTPDINGWGGVDRYLFVRNPFTRYMSVYTYLRAPANYSQWGAKAVQGSEWPGIGTSAWSEEDPMLFEEFLFWLSDMRRQKDRERPPFTSGAAYRSPWVWTDSLTMSLDMLTCQPGEAEGEVSLVRLERINEVADVEGSLAWLLANHGLDGEVQIGGIHANRTTGYGAGSANTRASSDEFWGGIKCTRKAQFNAWDGAASGVKEKGQDHCGACAVGVVAEADALGYLA
jgi:hypothetical protein